MEKHLKKNFYNTYEKELYDGSKTVFQVKTITAVASKLKELASVTKCSIYKGSAVVSQKKNDSTDKTDEEKPKSKKKK